MLNIFKNVAPAVDMMNGTMEVVAKSMLTKICPPGDIGKLFSVMAVIDLIVPLIFETVYNTLCENTLETFPGSVFILTAGITIPPQFIYM